MDKAVLTGTGMTPEQIQTYLQLEEKLLPAIEPLAQAYLADRDSHISQMRQPLHGLCATESEQYAAELVFVMRCIELRAQTLQGREKALFLEAAVDISCKINECLAYKKVFGIFVFDWYHGLIKKWRVNLGRLQFETGVFQGEDLTVGDFTLHKGDKQLRCHIPSLGPLRPEACLASYRRAWEEFPEYRSGGILPVLCTSWLLYPDYDRVFPESSNVGQFRKDYTVYGVDHQQHFEDCWRVFSMDMPGDPDLLPRNTRMQQRFADYIRQGGTFGNGAALLLFDGEKILK